jgi:hypothetical protein
METKILEVRDAATFIPVLATAMKSDNPIEKWYLKRTGYPTDHPLIMIAPLYGGKAEYGPYKWGESPRTLFIAHKYIEENWDCLETGDVVDVEWILGERGTPKVSERFGQL